jgi:SAM-dependent methyltransferase
MRAQLAARNPDVEALEGSAEHIPLPDAAVDAVVCAQAFHWFANAAALNEIRRVLKPGGVLGLIWNVRDESVDWVAELSRITDHLEGDAPRYRSGQWRRMFPADGFAFLGERHFRNAHVGTPEHVIVDRTLSVSFIAARPPEEQDAVATAVRALIAATPALAGRAEVAFPYETATFAYRKIG